MTFRNSRCFASALMLGALSWSSSGHTDTAADPNATPSVTVAEPAPSVEQEAAPLLLRAHGDFTLTELEQLSSALSATVWLETHPTLETQQEPAKTQDPEILGRPYSRVAR